MKKTPGEILKETFGYETFKPLQQEVIENVLSKRDTLAVMPTGGGKSLCYQIPALIFDGLTIVVSPLIALMKDQVEQMHSVGVPAVFLNSSLSSETYQAAMASVRQGKVKLLYVAPETLLTPRIADLLSSVTIDCITIDEAHCISEWGHDFRPDYRQLVPLRKKFPKAVCLAMTATATPRVRADITKTLGFKSSNEFVASFNRPNLYIEVQPKMDPTPQTIKFISGFKDQSGIIYCLSRKQADQLSETLSKKGFSVLPYHAGLEDDIRRKNQEAFIRDDIQIIVATIAFGMGINKPNVRFVLHHDLPKSLENYYQEIGRAGRDGLPAHCLLLYSYSDVAKLKFIINNKEGEEKQVANQHLDTMVSFAEDDSNCRRKPLLQYFGEVYKDNKCTNCDNCSSPPPVLDDITIHSQKFLSCVYRTGERFGAGHIVDVLMGSKNEKVLRLSHDKLSTYGIGADLTKKQWMNIARQLARMDYLNEGEFHTLKLTSRASEVLKNRSKIFGKIKEDEAKAPKKSNIDQLEYNHALFAILRNKRKELADLANVPPYIIFSDRTLIELASFLPRSIDSLKKINGIGQVKVDKYGAIFLELIVSYCEKHDIPEKEIPAPVKLKKTGSINEKGDKQLRYRVIGNEFLEGTEAPALAEKYQLNISSIVSYLLHFLPEASLKPRLSSLYELSASTSQIQQQVFTAFDEHTPELLKPIFEIMNETVSYDELRLLKLIYLTEHE